MINLRDSRFYDLLSPNLRKPHTLALSYALDNQMRTLSEYIPIVYMFSLVENLSETMCDTIALNLNIAEYQMDMSITTKREMLRLAFQVSARNGTTWAVNQLIATIFGHGETEEWFQYGGEPYYFRVRSTNPLATPEDARRFRAAINGTKNVRSWLDDILILRTWGDVLEPNFWREFQDEIWKEFADGHEWKDYSATDWDALKDKNWEQILAEKSWGKVLGKHIWADTFGGKNWQYYATESWSDISNLLWKDVLGEKTWGQVYSYIWEENI